jgi:phosphate transport system protein
MPQHLQREIERLKKDILSLGAEVEESADRAVKAVLDRNDTLARRVIEFDQEIDLIEVEIEENCLKILALYQPVATDLRFIIAALKINSDLERIGDLAVNIANRAVYLNKRKPRPVSSRITKMAKIAQRMIKMSLDALVNLDVNMAHEVCALDDEVDIMHSQLFAETQEVIKDDDTQIEHLLTQLSISRHLERMADHSTNIAEDVIYMIEGEIVRHRVEDFFSG